MWTFRRGESWAKTLWGGLGLLLAVSGCWGTDHPPAGTSTELKALKVGSLPIEDPLSPVWDTAPEATVVLLPQSITYPILGRRTIGELKARALSDDKFLGLRLSWADKTHDETLEVDKFTDAVAVELPLGDPQKTNPMMGSSENPVYILHWKAVWQRDVDKGRRRSGSAPRVLFRSLSLLCRVASPTKYRSRFRPTTRGATFRA